MTPDTSCFKAYDIRGIYGKNLTDELAEQLGKALPTFLKARTMVVGQDMRLESGRPLKAALLKGLLARGCRVFDIGLCSTDMYYFAIWHLKADGGVMITASHNPKGYNGFKLNREKANPIGVGLGMEEIKALIENNRFPEKKEHGRVKEKDIMQAFVSFVHSFVDAAEIKKLKVVFDAGNGMAGFVAPQVFKNIHLDKTELFYKLDENFPHHEPNPLKDENNKLIVEKIKEIKPDLGIAWDGDCDRVFFFDEMGNRIPGDFMTGFLAKQMLKRFPERSVLYDLRASWYVRDAVQQAGGKPIMMRVGHAYFKKAMKDFNAIFAGEVSGHYYFCKDDFAAENGFVPALMILQILSETGKTMSELMAETEPYHISGEINSEVEDKESIMQRVEEAFPGGKHYHLDGLSIEFEDWHFNLRPSNTEPLLRLTVEAMRDRGKMEAMRDKILTFIHR